MNKLVVITTTYPRYKGDTEPAFVHLLNKELSKDFEVHVVAPWAKGTKNYEVMDAVHVHRFKYLPFKLQNLCYDGGILPKLKSQPLRVLEVPFLVLGMFFAAAHVLIKNKAAIIHAHWLLPHGLVAVALAKLGGNKLIVTSHGSDLYSLSSKLFQRIKIYVIRHASVVTVVSRAMQIDCMQMLKGIKPPTVAPMGIDCRETFMQSVPFEDRNGFVFVGRLIETKGVYDLLEAFAQLIQDYPDEHLTIVGDGPEYENIEKWLDARYLKQSVSLVGSVKSERVADFFNKARVAIVPSWQEGLGLVIAEALACGCITAVSNIANVQDIHNEPLLQFEVKDAVSLAHTLEYIKENESEALRLSQALKCGVLDTYDWGVVGRQYRQILSSLS